jgi:hypothetical protein
MSTRDRLDEVEHLFDGLRRSLKDYTTRDEVRGTIGRLRNRVSRYANEVTRELQRLRAEVNALRGQFLAEQSEHRRVLARIDDLQGLVSAHERRLRRIADQRRMLDQQEREELKVRWPYILCGTCGVAHIGVCPRIRRQLVRSTPSENTVDTWYWGDNEWVVPADAVTADDVWDTGVAGAVLAGPRPEPPPAVETQS